MSNLLKTSPLEKLKVLHILTLDGASGEFGGPARVSAELAEASSNLNSVKIYSGVYKLSKPIEIANVERICVEVNPISKRIPISSLWSWRVPGSLWRSIASCDLVHIHFARDLIPIISALICIVQRIPYVIQTHGMIKLDKRFSIRILDVLVKFIAKKACWVIVLSNREKQEICEVIDTTNIVVLPNGIKQSQITTPIPISERDNTVLFCSRIDKRKRPDWFIRLAKHAFDIGLQWKFEIYGHDYGELKEVIDLIKKYELSNSKYCGVLTNTELLKKLSMSKLLILPSLNEPFPMIILEAFSVGTPAIIMPSCGLSENVRGVHPELVVQNDSLVSLLDTFDYFLESINRTNYPESLIKFCNSTFQISNVVERLQDLYLKAIS